MPADSGQQPQQDSSNEKPWFGDGLNFKCTGCGNCCTGSPGFVWVTDEDIAAIADYLEKPIGEIRLLHTRPAKGRTSLTEFGNGDCTFFDHKTRGCKIYPVRPIQCRTWPFWNSNIVDEAAWKETQRGCPGAGTGDFVPLEDIRKQAAAIDL